MTAAKQLGRPERCVHVHHTARGSEYVEVELVPLADAQGNVTFYMERMQPLPAPDIANAYVGSDPSFLRTLELIRRVARSSTSVLLLGETGTGKELMARAVHDLSSRADNPFVVVDCAGLTESLFESELFGHEKGSFTGATAFKRGLVDVADGGTLFIDEVGDIPLALQVKLLRLIETGVYRRVGGTEVQRADFRLVAATHRDLAGMVRDGRFRSDLSTSARLTSRANLQPDRASWLVDASRLFEPGDRGPCPAQVLGVRPVEQVVDAGGDLHAAR
jgi:transcriptional regulator with PAS, ATPase and Fis domain